MVGGESSRTLGRASATAAPLLSSVRASSRAHRSPRPYRPRARRGSRPSAAGQPLHRELRNRTELITLAPRDSASATEQVGLFRVTADAMAHRPLPGRRCPWLSMIARPLQPGKLHARSPLLVLTTAALSFVDGSPALLVNLSPRLRAPARLEHHAQNAVDAVSGWPSFCTRTCAGLPPYRTISVVRAKRNCARTVGT
jgi:hypothetical protein